jgi:hypothetical protein
VQNYINKKQILSIIEKYNILWNVVAQPDEYLWMQAGRIISYCANNGHISDALYKSQLTYYYM